MKTKDKGGRPEHVPDDRSRQMVEVLSGFGIPQDKIADVIGVDGKTLRKHDVGIEIRVWRSTGLAPMSKPATASETTLSISSPIG
jgi:hypothetical protein